MKRFWDKVDRRGPDECWEWLAARNKVSGYGAFGVGSNKVHTAHRFSFYLDRGRFPTDCCLHRCDNRGCVNPGHLYEGTILDNIADMHAKGRGWSKLTRAQVETIKLSLAHGVNQKTLARKYCMSASAINAIATGRKWSSV